MNIATAMNASPQAAPIQARTSRYPGLVAAALCLVMGPAWAQTTPSAVPGAVSANAVQPASLPETGAPPQAGVLKLLRGDVRLASKGQAARPVTAGDRLVPADRIVTGPDSGASVVLRDGTTMVVGPSSQLDLKDFSFNTTTQEGSVMIALIEGSMRMVSGLIGKLHPETVRIETRTALIGVRGTDFIVEADPQP